MHLRYLPDGIHLFNHCHVFEDFTHGAVDGIKTAAGLLPTLLGLLTGIKVLRASGLLDFLCGCIGRLVHFFGIQNFPEELLPLALIKLISASASNVLLFGDSGTGKSTSIKAIVNQFYDDGLRMIEIYKHQFKDLSTVISEVKNRNYKFIIYMDDLSFEEFEIEYKFLKAVIEGGVETKPENILIYATSNRRHLIKETWKDRDDVEADNGIHRSDTIEEKMSLVNRFGVTISYSKPSQKEYFSIVTGLAEKAGITMSEEELKTEANKWELSHGGISGRTAQQFINYLQGISSTEEK